MKTLLRVGVLSLLTYLSGYLIFIAGKHCKECFRYHDLAVKFKMLELYIKTLQEKDQGVFVEALLKKFLRQTRVANNFSRYIAVFYAVFKNLKEIELKRG